MKILQIIIPVVLLFLSCGNSRKIKEDLKILQSKSITIPKDVKILVHGEDSVINNFMDSELKWIVYADSVSCNSCIVSNMTNWMNLVFYAEAFNDRLKYYFIFNPRKSDEDDIRLSLKTSYFDYPIILDIDGKFEKLNPHLPKNKAMHTFLLDKDNKVILVGDPLRNKKIKETFYEMVEERLGKQ